MKPSGFSAGSGGRPVRRAPSTGRRWQPSARPKQRGTGPAATGDNRQLVALVAYDGLGMFEFGVACDIFGTDWSAALGVPWYRFAACSAGARAITVDGGYRLKLSNGLGALREAGTILVPPSVSAEKVPNAVLSAVRQAHDRGARIVSLCTGAFILASAGLLAGRSATTHWSACADLACRHPDVHVDPDALYIDDGDIMTSAGRAAGIDLCLHLVRHDYGAEVAALLARQLVVPPYRDGGQAQYIDAPVPQIDGADLLTDTLAWVQQHLDQPLSLDELADRSAMSKRTFARRFAASTGTTPYQWLLRQRLQLAKQLLETSDLPVDSIARKTGFSTAANLRKHFSRLLRTSPQAYRSTFRSREAQTAES
jgi:AraC family transcriptional regulator, transcriptional activator FtrA